MGDNVHLAHHSELAGLPMNKLKLCMVILVLSFNCFNEMYMEVNDRDQFFVVVEFVFNFFPLFFEVLKCMKCFDQRRLISHIS